MTATPSTANKFSSEDSHRKAPRILAGERRGLALQTPSGMNTRPIAARARKSLFDKIQHSKGFQATIGRHMQRQRQGAIQGSPQNSRQGSTQDSIQGSPQDSRQDSLYLLDVFAGSGALGIEALSRWRGHADFFEREHAAIVALSKNLLVSELRGRVHRQDALNPPAYARGDEARITLAFFSPPYGLKVATKAPEAFAARGWFAREALIIFQQAPVGDKGLSKNKANNKTKRETKLCAMEEQPQLGEAFALEDCLVCSSACFFFFRYRPPE